MKDYLERMGRDAATRSVTRQDGAGHMSDNRLWGLVTRCRNGPASQE